MIASVYLVLTFIPHHVGKHVILPHEDDNSRWMFFFIEVSLAVTGCSSVVAAVIAAAVVAAIVPPADDEGHDAPQAGQLVNGNVDVKGSGATARSLDVNQDRGTYDSSKARLWVYDRRLELLTRAFTLFGAPRSSGRERRRATSQHVVPWFPGPRVPGDPGGKVPFKPGGDKSQRWIATEGRRGTFRGSASRVPFAIVAEGAREVARLRRLPPKPGAPMRAFAGST